MATPAQQLPRYRHRPARTPGWASAQHVYRPRRPSTTPLYPVVQHHLERFLAQATENDPMGYGAILVHLELPHTTPPISPARGPGHRAESVVGDFQDQTPAFDPTGAEPIPDFVFDQSLPDEFDN